MLARGQLVTAAALILMTGSALAQGDAQKGKQAFAQCSACHSLQAGQNRVGPTLHGLFGRKAGTVTGYNYSAAMKRADVVWNEETLKKYLSDPKSFIPGNKMIFPGIKDNAKLEDLIAYLKTATK
ncbi:MAG TPA: cytochrome c family protein [Pseudolabrys sp.]|nr:cytochrome c family protein [Pseudolabrys sp.]